MLKTSSLILAKDSVTFLHFVKHTLAIFAYKKLHVCNYQRTKSFQTIR